MSSPKGATLVLASSSPRRQELIRSLNLPVVIRPSAADESVPGEWEPDRIVEELSLRKAKATLAGLVRDGGDGEEEGAARIVVGSDTIVVLDGDVLGKPRDAADAEGMLARLQGRSHLVYSGVACLKAAGLQGSEAGRHDGEPASRDTVIRLGDTGRYRSLSAGEAGGGIQAVVGHTVSKVTFRPMSDKEIEAYVKTGESLDKAGSYGVQGIGAIFIEKIEGDFYSVMGLPLNMLYQVLLKFGVNPF